MSAPWKAVLVVAVLWVAAIPAADPLKPVQLPLTAFEVLALVHTETSDDAVIRKLKDSGTHFAPGAPELRQLRQLGVTDKVLSAMTTEPVAQVVQKPPYAAMALAAEQTACAAPAKLGRPVGTWVREVGPMRIVMKFTEGRMTVTANVPGPEGEGDVVFTADADYCVNPEGLIFGVISGIDADVPEAALELQAVTGHTFSARCRVDGTTMTVKDMKAFGSGLKMNGEADDFAGAMLMACGRYTRDDDAKPVKPRKAKPRTEKGAGLGAAIGSMLGAAMGKAMGQVPGTPPMVHDPRMLPPGAVVQAVPQPVPTFNPPMMAAPPAMAYPQPVPPGGILTAEYSTQPFPIHLYPQARSANPATKQYLTIVSTGAAMTAAPGPLPPNPGYTFSYLVVPSPYIQKPSKIEGCAIVPNHPELPDALTQAINKAAAGEREASFPDVCTHPSIQTFVSGLSGTAAANGPLVGSWMRETDGMQVIAKFTEKRAFFTLNVAILDGKEVQRFTVRAEADYAVGPDGTVFGVVTGTDFTPPKGDASRSMLDELRQLAELSGSPFCFRFRLDEGNLNVRDLRCGEMVGRDFAARNPEALVILGRYKPLGNQEPALPKPVKMKANDACPNCLGSFERIGVDFESVTPAGATALPSPHYLQHQPQFVAPKSDLPVLTWTYTYTPAPEVAPAPRPAPRR